jgi:hypothetical protein
MSKKRVEIKKVTSQTGAFRTYQSSEAIPKSLQHLINALLLQPSEAVGKPELSKKSCSPLACETNLDAQSFSFLENCDDRFYATFSYLP